MLQPISKATESCVLAVLLNEPQACSACYSDLLDPIYICEWYCAVHLKLSLQLPLCC
jgi:hypothetical protein